MQSSSLQRIFLLFPFVFLFPVSAQEAGHGLEFPSTVTLRAPVLTNTVPLAYYDEDYATNHPDYNEPFPAFRGFQPDLLRQMIKIAADLDNVTLTFELEQAPPFSYPYQFEYMARDCNQTSNRFTDFEPHSWEDCNRWDLVIGDYYGYPTRSIRTLLTPPLMTTAAATIQYVHRTKRAITTLQEAQALQEPVCLLDESHYDREALLRFPNLKIFRCFKHEDCIRWVKEERCALFVEDELQLRYIMTQDAALEVTPEKWNEQYIVWPINFRLDPMIQQLIIRWMYQAKVSGFLNQLYDQYFSINFCPLGTAGENCDEPCDASHGMADRHGNCVCQSTRWTGEDCSVEVVEDKNLIPTSLVTICYIMVGINFLAVAICAIWLVWNRNTPQVKVSQPVFLGLVLLGCVISTSTIFAMAQEHDGSGGDGHSYGQTNLPSCMAIVWLYSIGFSITFGSLFAKIRRVYILFKAAATMTRVSVTAKETILVVGGVLLIDVTILTVWTIIDPLRWHREAVTVDKFGHALSSEGYCISEHFAIFASIIAAFHFTLMGVACYLCYLSREIPTQFSEGKYVTIAMISNLQIFVVAIPVLIILGSDPQTSFFVRSVIIWMNDFAVLALVFGNLMYSVHMEVGENDTSKTLIRKAMSTYTERRNKRLSVAATGRGSSHSTAAVSKTEQTLAAIRPSMLDAGSLLYESKAEDLDSSSGSGQSSSSDHSELQHVAESNPGSNDASQHDLECAVQLMRGDRDGESASTIDVDNTAETSPADDKSANTATTMHEPSFTMDLQTASADDQSDGPDFEATPDDEPLPLAGGIDV